MKRIYSDIKTKSLALLVLLIITDGLFAQTSPNCQKSKNNGPCITTTLTSVKQLPNGSYRIVLMVASNASTGPVCKTLSHYSVQAVDKTVSDVSVKIISPTSSDFTDIDMGPNLGKSSTFDSLPQSGFKLNGPPNVGDGHACTFTVAYTIAYLQNQQIIAFAGSNNQSAYFTIADFNSVNKCAQQTGPTAVNDDAATNVNTPVDINVLTNDIAGSSAIDASSVTFTGTAPDPATVGTFSFNSTTHLVTFTPAENYTGTATIGYQILDANRLTSQATITVTISPLIVNHFPSTYGTLAFEDLWPSKGDYDFNDLVLDYQFEITSDINNYVQNLKGTFVIKAFGASLENGFGFQLPGIANANDLTVTGYSLTDNYIKLNNNGTESGQAKPTIIVYDNAFKQMTHPGAGIGVNTDPAGTYVTPKTLVVNIAIKPNTYKLNDLDISNFNPFLIVNKVRGVEVHLPNYAPTSLADPSLFGTSDDNSDPSQNRYYKTATNLPWAINIIEKFDYSKEKVDISRAYLHFAEWAVSGGTSYQDWFKDLPGNRNAGLIYLIPQ
ncbi:MAG: LruC domain-containing protein [Bacteroidota bacterium]|nr:LruC domain-containing protein [Bacteroidota bacterium]